MAGPLTIQRVPRGMLDWLDMKGTGQLPAELADQLRATIDSTYCYLIDKLYYQNGAQGRNTSGNTQYPALHTVPPWRTVGHQYGCGLDFRRHHQRGRQDLLRALRRDPELDQSPVAAQRSPVLRGIQHREGRGRSRHRPATVRPHHASG